MHEFCYLFGDINHHDTHDEVTSVLFLREIVAPTIRDANAQADTLAEILAGEEGRHLPLDWVNLTHPTATIVYNMAAEAPRSLAEARSDAGGH